MPQLILKPDCQFLIDSAGVTEIELTFAARNPDLCLASNNWERLTFVRWLSDDDIIFADGTITKATWMDGRQSVEEMEPVVVLALRPELPAGKINPQMDVEDLLALVAESFGVPVRCHLDEPHSTLYCGPWDLTPHIRRLDAIAEHRHVTCGYFERESEWASNVYVIDVDRYLAWLRG